MPNSAPFLSDTDVWMCFCYTALAQAEMPAGAVPLDGPACDRLARRLAGDPATRVLDPVLAARAALQNLTAQAA